MGVKEENANKQINAEKERDILFNESNIDFVKGWLFIFN
jgi:hypothetical protein